MVGNVAIPYDSGRGHTRRLAEVIAAALGEGGCDARLIDVTTMTDLDWQALDAADAIVMGAPTYMGSASAGFKTFMDATGQIWANQGWADKLAAGFTVATFPGGDKLNTLMQLSVFAAQHGMVWIGQDQIGAPANKENPGINASGVWLGLGATSSRDKTLMVEAGDIETAHRFGLRIARLVRRWQV
jgi:NAD(P)H dehydrogenase (quinone)